MMIEVFSLAIVRERFGASTPRRQFLYERLHAVVTRLYETGKVKHIYLFGSYPTATSMPNDVDLFVVMAADFRTTGLTDELLAVFTHDTCRIRYNADVFWVTESIGAEHIADALTVFSRDRQFRAQPIVEVIP
jgi:predicted nucleotidyltransferase